jgi:hypothetical protein
MFVEKLKQENMTMGLGIQSRNELVLEMAAEMGLNRMREADNKDDDDDNGGDASATATTTPTPATPIAATPKAVSAVTSTSWTRIFYPAT